MTAPTGDSRLLLVGDIHDDFDGPGWTDALRAAGWMGPIIVHEHPGRTGDLPIRGGNHEVLDPAFALGGTDAIGPDVVVIGFGRSGPPAMFVALGGQAAAVCVVDGLGGPFVDPDEQIGATFTRLRALMADESCHSPPGPGEVDRRLRHPMTAHGDRATTERMLAALSVPTLVVETPASPLDANTAREVAPAHVNASNPADIATAICAWHSENRR